MDELNATNIQREMKLKITTFLEDRLQIKLEALSKRKDLKSDSEELKKKEDEERERFMFNTWIRNAATRASQIHEATHVLKFTHPDAKAEGKCTDIFCKPDGQGQYSLVGTHCLPEWFKRDAAGNAAALDILEFLYLNCGEETLLSRMQRKDLDLAAVMSTSKEEAFSWMEDFVKIRPDGPPVLPSSHTLAKQVYWLVGDDPCDNSHYRLLAPLFASSLAHYVFSKIEHDIYDEESKRARNAIRENSNCDVEVHSYRHLAIQKIGGGNPQNISSLNSKRNGKNYLLASSPPSWTSMEINAPYGVADFFDRFGRSPEIIVILNELRAFLESNPPPNECTRNKRDDLLDQIVSELHLYVFKIRKYLEPGWSADERCELHSTEKLWLDQGRSLIDSQFRMDREDGKWEVTVRKRFGNWMNDTLGSRLPLGDIENAFWMDALKEGIGNDGLSSNTKNLETLVN